MVEIRSSQCRLLCRLAFLYHSLVTPRDGIGATRLYHRCKKGEPYLDPCMSHRVDKISMYSTHVGARGGTNRPRSSPTLHPSDGMYVAPPQQQAYLLYSTYSISCRPIYKLLWLGHLTGPMQIILSEIFMIYPLKYGACREVICMYYCFLLVVIFKHCYLAVGYSTHQYRRERHDAF